MKIILIIALLLGVFIHNSHAADTCENIIEQYAEQINILHNTMRTAVKDVVENRGDATMNSAQTSTKILIQQLVEYSEAGCDIIDIVHISNARRYANYAEVRQQQHPDTILMSFCLNVVIPELDWVKVRSFWLNAEFRVLTEEGADNGTWKADLLLPFEVNNAEVVPEGSEIAENLYFYTKQPISTKAMVETLTVEDALAGNVLSYQYGSILSAIQPFYEAKYVIFCR